MNRQRNGRTYLLIPCPRCGRKRLYWYGFVATICEACGWRESD